MITYRKLENIITGVVNGKPFNLPRTEEVEKELKKLQKADASTEDVLAFVKTSHDLEVANSNKYLIYVPIKNEYYLTFNGYRSKHPIPESLRIFIETSYDKNIDFMPVIKAWARLLDNVRYTPAMGAYFNKYLATKYVDDDEVSRVMEEYEYTYETAKAMCTYQDIAITQEGLLATYKVAEEVTWEYVVEKNEDGVYQKVKKDRYKIIPAVVDKTTGEIIEEARFEKPEYKEDLLFTPAIWKNGDKFFSGKKLGYVYEIGKMQHLPKDAIRNLNNTSGGGGLYIGGLYYIRYFRGGDKKVLTCFVNPADIISFQSEGNALRTDALFPNDVWDEESALKGVYHSSEYDKLSTERLQKLVEEVVDEEVKL